MLRSSYHKITIYRAKKGAKGEGDEEEDEPEYDEGEEGEEEEGMLLLSQAKPLN